MKEESKGRYLLWQNTARHIKDHFSQTLTTTTPFPGPLPLLFPAGMSENEQGHQEGGIQQSTNIFRAYGSTTRLTKFSLVVVFYYRNKEKWANLSSVFFFFPPSLLLSGVMIGPNSINLRQGPFFPLSLTENSPLSPNTHSTHTHGALPYLGK